MYKKFLDLNRALMEKREFMDFWLKDIFLIGSINIPNP